MMGIAAKGKEYPSVPKKEQGDGPDPEEQKEGDLSAIAGRKAATSILSAIEAGDNAALDRALRKHYEACE